MDRDVCALNAPAEPIEGNRDRYDAICADLNGFAPLHYGPRCRSPWVVGKDVIKVGAFAYPDNDPDKWCQGWEGSETDCAYYIVDNTCRN